MTDREKDDLITLLRAQRDQEIHRSAASESKLRETENWLEAARADAKAWKEKFDEAERLREKEYRHKLDRERDICRLLDKQANLERGWGDLATRVQAFERRRDNHLAARKDAMQASIYATLIRTRAERYGEGPNYVEIRDCEADFALAKKATDTYWRLKGED
jgi:chromosome segregation ATPase